MDEAVKQHLASTQRLTEEALLVEGALRAVALCHQAKQELAQAENLLIRAVTQRACDERRH